MRLGYVVLKLRLANTSFENRIGGSAALALALESTLAQEMVFVIPLSETAPANAYDSGINQVLTERFGLVVALKMDADPTDKTGIRAFDRLHDVRGEFLSALSGWEMPDAGVDSLVYYVGGRLLDFNRAWMWYQFEFEFQTRLEEMTQPDTTDVGVLNQIYAQYVLGTWAESGVELSGIPPFLPIQPDVTTTSEVELVVNGGFDSDTVWTKDFNATISGGYGRVADLGGGMGRLLQTLALVAGERYKVKVTCYGQTGSKLDLSIDGDLVLSTIVDGLKEAYYIAKNPSSLLDVMVSGVAMGEVLIDDVSVKRVISYDVDMTQIIQK